jgi:hypothetical protein
MRSSARLRLGATLVALAALTVVAAPAEAKKTKADPALVCASSKHKEAAKYCGAVLKAWSKFE